MYEEMAKVEQVSVSNCRMTRFPNTSHTILVINGMGGGESRKIGNEEQIIEELDRAGFFFLAEGW